MKILRYTILSSLLLVCLSLKAQDEPRQITKYVPGADEAAEKIEKFDSGPLFQGVSVSADVLGMAGKIFGQDYTSNEFSLQVNLKNRFFPVFEFGYGKCDYTDDDRNIHYKTSGSFFRAGLNYNFLWKKRQTSYLFGGLRYAYAPFNYDVTTPPMTDPVWGSTVPITLTGVKGNMSWGELVVGLQAKVCSIIHMGWTLRYKVRLTKPNAPNSNPWYVPGFGTYNGHTFGATYDIIIDLPFWKAKKTTVVDALLKEVK